MNQARIGLVFTSDFAGYPPGGGQPTVEIFLKYAQDRPWDIWLIGMTTRRDESVGKVSYRRIYGRKYPFIPLFYADYVGDRRPLIPIRLQAMWAYSRFRRMIDAMQFDLLYLHEPQDLPFLFLKKQPILYHVHGTQESAATYSRYGLFRSRIFMLLYRFIIRHVILERADQFIVIDDESYNLYTSMVPHRKERFHLFPTAIDVDQFRPLPHFDRWEGRQQFGLPPEGKLVLFVGRLSWKKGVDLIIRSFSLLAQRRPDVYLAIAGSGEDRPALEALVHELGLNDRVFFLGSVPHLPNPDLPRLYNCADVSVVASFHESLALVITEALACGIPVVSTPVGIAPKVIKNGVTGYLLQSRDPKEMAAYLTQVLEGGTIDRAQCVTVAREYAETSRRICDLIEAML